MDINELCKILTENAITVEQKSELTHQFVIKDCESDVVLATVEATDLVIAFVCIATDHEFQLTGLIKKGKN